MEFEDSRLALFSEPNAFIQNFNNPKQKEKEIKKIVFQEPYETLPNFYINNNFTKHNCDCVKGHNSKDCNCDKDKHFRNNQSNNLFPKDNFCYNHDCNCNHENLNSKNYCQHDDNCHNVNSSKLNGFGFDLKSLLPLLGMFNKGGGADLGSIVSLLNNNVKSQDGNNSNPMNLISSLLSNKDAVSGILNMFKGGGLNMFNKKQSIKKELKTTDFEIKNYTRVN